MSKFDPTEYGITIRKRPVDGHMYFVGTVSELPDVEVYEDSYENAYSEVTNIISDLKAVAENRGRAFPLPAEVKDEEFSGRATLRLSKSLHRKAAGLAEREGVSLNQFFVSVIAEAVGEKAAVEAKPHPQVPTISTGVRFAGGGSPNWTAMKPYIDEFVAAEVSTHDSAMSAAAAGAQVIESARRKGFNEGPDYYMHAPVASPFRVFNS